MSDDMVRCSACGTPHGSIEDATVCCEKDKPGVVGPKIELDLERVRIAGERMWATASTVPDIRNSEIIMAAGFVVYNAGADE